jgi:CHAT domain-containing protein
LSEKGYSKIYVSPDGVYHTLNLGTLRHPKTGAYLIEQQPIELITSSRDLINRKENKFDLSANYEAYQAFLFGYPAYDRDKDRDKEKNNTHPQDTTQTQNVNRSLNGLQRVIGQQKAVPLLAGTKTETNRINELLTQKGFSSRLFQNENASEEELKAIDNPTILHIATHGFFIDEIPDSKVTTMQEAEDRNMLKNPLLRSGLLLAGCQNPQAGQEDGILSAEEAMNLHLNKTELVVLSACETALGEIQNGEGVYGLQRAFRQAGAKTVLMSLWKVDDKATELLMVYFYENLLQGQPKRLAFRNAQLKLKESYSNPRYWGAFVMVGE